MRRSRILPAAVLLTASLLIISALSSCGAKDDADNRSLVYSSKNIAVPEGYTVNYLAPMRFSDGRVYISCYGEDRDRITWSVDLNGENGAAEEGSAGASREGGVVTVSTELPDGGRVAAEFYNSSFDAELVRTDKKGNTVFRLDLEKLFGVDLEKQPIDYSGDRGFRIVEILYDGTCIYVASPDSVLLLTEDGTVTGSIITGATSGKVMSMALLSDGTPILRCGSYPDYKLRRLDRVGQKLGEIIELPGEFSNATVLTGPGYDFWLKNNTGFYGYDLAENKATQIIDWVASDIIPASVSQVLVVDSETFVVGGYDSQFGEPFNAVLTMLPADAIPQREKVKIAYVGCDPYLSAASVVFNRESEKYRVELVDYGRFNTEADRTIGLTRLHADMASGEAPDILIIDSFNEYGGKPMSASDYISKGMLVDFYTLFDDDFSADDLLDCCRYPFETDGALYRIPMQYALSSNFGLKEDFPDPSEWTLRRAFEYMKAMPGDVSLSSYNGSFLYLNNITGNSFDAFIDYESGKCSFDSDFFIEILEYIKSAPGGEVSKDIRVILKNDAIYDIDKYLKLKMSLTGYDPEKEIINLGFPSEDGGRSEISPVYSYAILSGGNINGAWEYMKFRLSDRIQRRIYDLPATASAFEAKLEECMGMKYNFFYSGGYVKIAADMEFDPNTLEKPGFEYRPTREDRDFVRNYVSSAAAVNDRDPTVVSLIREELDWYLGENGASAADCAKKIQNRVSLYIAEIG
ncbi:MAG: hypothetical protein GX628_07075 [Clostridiales bacterium]|nr:hypothetical protein [Clostridiales bacterium]